MAASRRRTQPIGDLALDSGEALEGVRVSYQSWGRLNAAKDNAVLILHALTGDSHVVGERGPDQPTPGWWPGLVGPGAPIDTDEYFVLAPSVLGGCRGTTGPQSVAPDGRPYGSTFPHLTIRDQVRAEKLLADALGVRSFALVVGGSVGGMRSLEWAVSYPGRVKRCVVLAASAAAGADQIAWSVPQLHAIRLDPAFHGGDYYPGPGPRAGLEVARQIAHATYRSATELDLRFGASAQQGEDPLRGGRYAVQSYLEHHGKKLVRRFDANSYLVLTEAMNTHDIGRGRGGVEAALRRITAELTVAAVSSDRLFPLRDSEVLAGAPACRELAVVDSPYGHDAFLIETEQVFGIIRRALTSAPVPQTNQPPLRRATARQSTAGAASGQQSTVPARQNGTPAPARQNGTPVGGPGLAAVSGDLPAGATSRGPSLW